MPNCIIIFKTKEIKEERKKQDFSKYLKNFTLNEIKVDFADLKDCGLDDLHRWTKVTDLLCFMSRFQNNPTFFKSQRWNLEEELTNPNFLFHFTFSEDCRYTTGRECRNGACLNSQCHCNDGYGGKGCDMPDDNECKYR